MKIFNKACLIAGLFFAAFGLNVYAMNKGLKRKRLISPNYEEIAFWLASCESQFSALYPETLKKEKLYENIRNASQETKNSTVYACLTPGGYDYDIYDFGPLPNNYEDIRKEAAGALCAGADVKNLQQHNNARFWCETIGRSDLWLVFIAYFFGGELWKI